MFSEGFSFFFCVVSLRSLYSKIPERLSANQIALFHRNLDQEKINTPTFWDGKNLASRLIGQQNLYNT